MPGTHQKVWLPPLPYRFMDNFLTAMAAADNPPRREATPGPGFWQFVDTKGYLSVVAGSTNLMESSNINTNGDPAAATVLGWSPTPGFAFLYTVEFVTSARGSSGWSISVTPTNTPAVGIGDSSGTLTTYPPGSSSYNSIFPYSSGTVGILVNTLYNVCLVWRPVGSIILIRRTTDTANQYYLIWVDNSTPSTLYHAGMWARVSAFTAYLGAARTRQLGAGGFTSQWGAALSHIAAPAANATLSVSAADGIVEFTWTPIANATLNLYIRYLDSGDNWQINCIQANSTIILYQNSSGQTQRSSVAQTWTAGTAYRIVVVAHDRTIQTFVANTAKNSYTSATVGETNTGVMTDTAGADLAQWPYIVTLPAGI